MPRCLLLGWFQKEWEVVGFRVSEFFRLLDLGPSTLNSKG